MKELFEKLKKNKTMCSIFNECDKQNKFDVGYVLAHDDDFLLIAGITPRGENDGFYLMLTENIFKIEEDTQYLNNLKKLRKIDGTSIIEHNFAFSKDVFISTLKHFVSVRELCTVTMCDDGDYRITGYPEKLDDEVLTMTIFDNQGRSDGKAYIRLEDITYVSFLSEDEAKIKKVM